MADSIVMGLVIAVAALGWSRWQRWRDARALEALLFAEAAALQLQAAHLAAELARRDAAGAGCDADFFACWRLSKPTVYPTAAAGLMRLRGGTPERLGYFHAQLADARARLAMAERTGQFAPSPYRFLSQLVRAHYTIEPWCAAMARRLRWLPAPLPDMLAASALVSRYEAAGDEPVLLAYCRFECAPAVADDRADDADDRGGPP